MIGEQLEAPEGFESLKKGEIYYFLGRYGAEATAWLVSFVHEKGKRIHAFPIAVRSASFECALNEGLIIATSEQRSWPPWLSKYEGKDLSSLDQELADLVDYRLCRLEPVLADENRIFCSENLEFEINRIARAGKPRVNETRLRFWFFAYLAFGRDKWVLLRPTTYMGHWRREGRDKKFGRPSRDGTRSGYPRTADMITRSVKGYKDYRALGKSMTRIWSDTLTLDFGCNTREISGIQQFFHPRGEPFPTFWQFYGIVRKAVPLKEIQEARLGRPYVRMHKSPSVGTYSEPVASLCERVEGDAYQVIEAPEGFFGEGPVDPLWVVRLRDLLSGYGLGIGFCFGQEWSQAYLSALFCMALNKVFYCSLYGNKLPLKWVSEGLPSLLKVDRGPGAALRVIDQLGARITVRQLPPSYSPQAKAGVEGTHPRTPHYEGRPTYVQSPFHYLALMRRELLQFIAQNHQTDVFGLIPRDVLRSLKLRTPHEVFCHWARRYRDNSHPVHPATAIRCFLPRIELRAREDGVYLYDQRYDSRALRECGVLDRVVASGREIPFSGYALPAVVRTIWLDVRGKLIEMNAMLPVRDSEEQLYVPIDALAEDQRLRREQDALMREHQAAVDATVRSYFKDLTGKSWDAGRRKAGTAKRRTRSARQHHSDLGRFAGKARKV